MKSAEEIYEVLGKTHHLFKPIIVETIQKIQEEKGNTQGAYELELLGRSDKEVSDLAAKGVPRLMVNLSIQKMIYENEIKFNKDYSQYSLLPLEGFMTWADVLETTMKGHQMNEKLEMVATSAPTHNYEQLLKIYLNKDPENLVEETKEFEKNVDTFGPLFLDGKSQVSHPFIGSLMRSGSTFLRKLIETITGVCTGSNFPNAATPCAALMIQGFKGEQVDDNRIWMKKTHFPYNYPAFIFPQSGSKAVICLRNPLDIIVSLFHLSVTLTHNKTCANDIPKEFPKEWEYQMKYGARIFEQFTSYWMKVQATKEAPVHFVRYEDLISNKREVLQGIFRFILGVESIAGTYIEKRIDRVLQEGEQGVLYKPRSGLVNSNAHYYSPAYLNYLQKMCRSSITFLGYLKVPENGNATGFFEYEDLKEEDIAKNGEFRKNNADCMSWYLAEKEKFDSQEITVHKPGEGIIMKTQDEPIFKFVNIRPQIVIK